MSRSRWIQAVSPILLSWMIGCVGQAWAAERGGFTTPVGAIVTTAAGGGIKWYDLREEEDFHCVGQTSSGLAFEFPVFWTLSNSGGYGFLSLHDRPHPASGTPEQPDDMQAVTERLYGQRFGAADPGSSDFTLSGNWDNSGVLDAAEVNRLPTGLTHLPSTTDIIVGTHDAAHAVVENPRTGTAQFGAATYVQEKVSYSSVGAPEGVIRFTGSLILGACTPWHQGHQCSLIPDAPKNLTFSGVCTAYAKFVNDNPNLPTGLVRH